MRTERLSLEGLKTANFSVFIVLFINHFTFSFIGYKISLSIFVHLNIPPDALESLRQSNESVCPNDGFLEQVNKKLNTINNNNNNKQYECLVLYFFFCL